MAIPRDQAPAAIPLLFINADVTGNEEMLKEKHLTYSEIHLDAMRGLAALVVAIGHGRGLFFPSLTNALLAGETVEHAHADPIMGLTLGHEAVMVFFVLSGYLVGGSVLKSFAADRWLWSGYLVKRLVRLWIVLVPAVFIGVLIDNIGLNLFSAAGSIYSAPPGQDYVWPDAVRSGSNIWIVTGNLLFLQGIFIPTAGLNVALWSLSNEFWYYLMFPMLLLVFQRGATKARRNCFRTWRGSYRRSDRRASSLPVFGVGAGCDRRVSAASNFISVSELACPFGNACAPGRVPDAEEVEPAGVCE